MPELHGCRMPAHTVKGKTPESGWRYACLLAPCRLRSHADSPGCTQQEGGSAQQCRCHAEDQPSWSSLAFKSSRVVLPHLGACSNSSSAREPLHEAAVRQAVPASSSSTSRRRLRQAAAAAGGDSEAGEQAKTPRVRVQPRPFRGKVSVDDAFATLMQWCAAGWLAMCRSGWAHLNPAYKTVHTVKRREIVKPQPLLGAAARGL
jgi:hypothetical protein